MLILEHAEAAAERAEASWQQLASGQGLLRTSGGDLGRASRDLRRRTERSVREWQADVLEMVRTQGADKRSTARFLAFGVNGLSVALMIVVFSHSYGLTGAEVGIAGRLGRDRARSCSRRCSATRRCRRPRSRWRPCSPVFLKCASLTRCYTTAPAETRDLELDRSLKARGDVCRASNRLFGCTVSP